MIRNNNEPWFVAKDICDALEISNNRDTLLKIPEKWKGRKVIPTRGGDQEMVIINEPAECKNFKIKFVRRFYPPLERKVIIN